MSSQNDNPTVGTTSTAVELTEKQRAWIDGLRQLADIAEQHPEIIANQSLAVFHGFYDWQDEGDPLESMTEFARSLGGRWEKNIDAQDDFRLEQQFGPHKLALYTSRENVCERIVRTETVTREIPDPDAPPPPPVPLITVTEEVETVTWVCPESVLEAAGAGS